MLKPLKWPGFLSLLFAALIQPPILAQQASEQSVGPGARLFVTKAYTSRDNLVADDFRQLADAGFTVAVKRWVMSDDAAYVDGAADAGLAAMIWRSGLVDADDDTDRTITHKGDATRYRLPFSRAAWQEVIDDAAMLAKLSLDKPALKGLILDFEIYDRKKTDGFCESYDDQTFVDFLKLYHHPAPDPLPEAKDRRAFLQGKGIAGLFVDHQVRLTAERVKQLRRTLDAINPRFQLGIYGWGVMVPAILEESATPEAPVLQLSAMTYGRTIYSSAFEGGYDGQAPDRPSLKWSLTTVAKEVADARSRSYPVVALGGHYPQSPGPEDGTQHRYTARQAFNSAAYGDGYWIWTDAYTPGAYASREAWIADMMAGFNKANAALDANDWMWSSRQVDPIPDPAATEPLRVLTRDAGGNATVWNPLTGLPEGSAGEAGPEPAASGSAGAPAVRVSGWQVGWVDGETGTARAITVGHGIRGAAFGDVDGVAGDELVTLAAGWVRIWDPASQAELLRFNVGPAARELELVPVRSPVADGHAADPAP